MKRNSVSNLRGYGESELYDHLKAVIEEAFETYRQENQEDCARNGWSMSDFRFEDADGRVNLLGVRGFSKDTMEPCTSSNMAWDDTCFVIYTLNGQKCVESYYLNTEQNSVDKAQAPQGGKSFLVTGTHRYRLGFHKTTQRALEPESVVKTLHDKNQNFVDDEKTGPQWLTTINIHFGGDDTSPKGWSAGCQTIRNQLDYDAFRTRIESDTSIIGSIDNEFAPRPKRNGTRVLIYTLVDGSCLVGPGAPAPGRGNDTDSPSTTPWIPEPSSQSQRPKGDRLNNPKRHNPPSAAKPERGLGPATDRPTVQAGSTGQAVQALQKRLTRLGHDPGPVDGSFGPRTVAAVRSFQKANALVADGIVRADTWSALMARAKSRQ
jgi:Putative peptidoglycan binding domain